MHAFTRDSTRAVDSPGPGAYPWVLAFKQAGPRNERLSCWERAERLTERSDVLVVERLSDQPARMATKRLPHSRSARAVTPVGETHIRVHEFGDNPLSNLVQGR
jgi:hypothetical protein